MSLRWSALALLAVVLGGCKGSDDAKPPADDPFGGRGGAGGSGASGGSTAGGGGHSGHASPDGGEPDGHGGGAGGGGGSSGSSGLGGSSGGSIGDAQPGDVIEELPPLIDAPLKDTAVEFKCDFDMAWWLESTSFGAPTPSAFMIAANELLLAAGQHPMTIATVLDEQQAWTLTASGTLTGGSDQQYFPSEYNPSFTSLTRTEEGFSTSALQNQGWLHLMDREQNLVWIALEKVATSAKYENQYCQILKEGRIDAVVPVTAASTVLQTSGGAKTVGELMGVETSSSPAGWNISVGFTASTVQVSFK